jgi:putative ABC transport system permease protein
MTLIGCLAGLAISIAGSSLVESFVRGIIPYAPSGKLISLDGWIIGVCVGFSVVLGVLCSIYPALRSARMTPLEAMRSDLE